MRVCNVKRVVVSVGGLVDMYGGGGGMGASSSGSLSVLCWRPSNVLILYFKN